MTSTLRTLWAKPWVRRPVLFALAVGATLALGYFVIDRVGKDAWREAQKQLAAEGETIDFRRLLPPDVPDAENFCAVGPLRNLAASESDHSPAGEEGRRNREGIRKMWESAGFIRAMPSKAGWSAGKAFDLGTLADALRRDGNWPIPKIEGDLAADVTAGFANWDAYFDELTPGLARPVARWTPALTKRLQKPPLGSGISRTCIRHTNWRNCCICGRSWRSQPAMCRGRSPAFIAWREWRRRARMSPY